MKLFYRGGSTAVLVAGVVLVSSGFAVVSGTVAKPGGVCSKAGASVVSQGVSLVCKKSGSGKLVWRVAKASTATTTSPNTSATTTVASANVAPRVVSASSVTGNAVITIADMSPDTGVYAVQWVPVGQGFNSFSMYRTTTKTMTAPYLSCTRTYTLRVFVMQENWQMTDGFVDQNVTPHSATFDLTMPACTATATATAAPVSCATAYCVGDTGPGGGIVFYVSATNFTSTGSDCNTTCKYLEAATSDQSTGIVWATTAEKCWKTATPPDDGSNNNSCQSFSIYSPHDTPNQADSRTAATAIGKGMANTNAIYDRFNSAGDAVATNTYAAGIAYAYANNGKTDWHLPSKLELNELCKYARTQTTGNTAVICANTGTLRGGFSAVSYWGSSEFEADAVWLQDFILGGATDASVKSLSNYVRPVRAFG